MNKSTWRQNIETLPSASFALVMATGIISIGAHLMHYEWISNILFIVNNIAYAVLWFMTIVRAFNYYPSLKANLSDHSKGAGFLTIIAGSCLLGNQYVLLKHINTAGITLLVIGICTWVLIIYSFFIRISIKKEKPDLEKGMNGSWLLFVVSTQSLSILSSNIISTNLPFASPLAIFLSFSAYLLGILFYIVLISIIFYRMAFFQMMPEEFQPSYWIDTGAAAITVLSGITMIKNFELTANYQDLIPTVKILSLLFWITSCWWLPIIGILEIWRHKSVPVKYSAGYWSLVFPLGMFSVCTWQLSDIYTIEILKPIAIAFLFISLFVWILTFTGLCKKIITSTVDHNQSK